MKDKDEINSLLVDYSSWNLVDKVKEFLIDNSEDVDITYDGGLALRLAISNSSLEMIEILLNYYENTKLKGNKESFEYKDAKHKLCEILQEIIEDQGLSQEIRDRLKAYIQIEEYFTQKDALIDKTPGLTATHVKNEQNIENDAGAMTPVLTSEYGSVTSTHTTNKDSSSKNEEPLTLHFEQMSMDTATKPANNLDYIALHSAIQGGHNNIKQILDKNPKLASIQDDYGQTPLHWAATVGNEEAVTLLLPKMTIEDISRVTKENGYSALHMALHTDEVHAYNHNIVEQVLAKCPKLASVPDKNGQTPLHWAAGKGITTAVVELLEILTNDEISIGSSKGNTALDLATTEEIRQILEVGSLEDYILERDLELIGNDDI